MRNHQFSDLKTGQADVVQRLVADADMPTVLSGGWYFASEAARVLDRPGLVSIEQGIEVLAEDGYYTGDDRA